MHGAIRLAGEGRQSMSPYQSRSYGEDIASLFEEVSVRERWLLNWWYFRAGFVDLLGFVDDIGIFGRK